MTKAQAGILASLPEQGRYVFFTLVGAGADLQNSLKKLQTSVDGQQVVAGSGPAGAAATGQETAADARVPAPQGPQFEAPSTPYALCLWLRGDQRGELIA
jgi:putative iron-dependent peroxidase